jgi:hypothetical protein
MKRIIALCLRVDAVPPIDRNAVVFPEVGRAEAANNPAIMRCLK